MWQSVGFICLTRIRELNLLCHRIVSGVGSGLSQGNQSNSRTGRKVPLVLNLGIHEVGAAASYLAVRSKECGGTRNHQLKSEKEVNKRGIVGGRGGELCLWRFPSYKANSLSFWFKLV